ncbi:MAG: YtxH domain-containing protein [Armatimonadota bacterium]|nr:YtxH domain-containing protein [bacterium]
MNENREEKSVVLNFLAGMGLGALIGAAAALLTAPKSGNETREDLKHVAGDIRDKASKVAHDLSESSDDLVKKSKDLLESTREKVQSAVQSGKQVVASKICETTEQPITPMEEATPIEPTEESQI